MNLPLDIIIPIYNQWSVAENCLNSIFASHNETAYEIIVVDDASTDPNVGRSLAALASEKKITLLTNPMNLGFTKSVNRGMRLHRDRDVLLLNSDTVVYANWVDRLHRTAYSQANIATANPLTNSSHISSYPFHGHLYGSQYEISDEMLDVLAAEINEHRVAAVHTTVGFCMYIQRAALDDVGLFDEKYFPYAYGEESDFCYRSRKVGWRHLVAGDVFVRHLEGQSFGERRARLVAEAVTMFLKLHPEFETLDREFGESDPIRGLRINLDLARLKLALARETELTCYTDGQDLPVGKPVLQFFRPDATVRIILSRETFSNPPISRLPTQIAHFDETFPNLPVSRLPAQIAQFNATLARLGVARLRFVDRAAADNFIDITRGQPFEVGLQVEVCA